MIDLKKDRTPAELRAMADALRWAVDVCSIPAVDRWHVQGQTEKVDGLAAELEAKNAAEPTESTRGASGAQSPGAVAPITGTAGSSPAAPHSNHSPADSEGDSAGSRTAPETPASQDAPVAGREGAGGVPTSGEVLGVMCVDGGKCHHKCTQACFRRECCSPLSGYTGPWKYKESDQKPVAHVCTDEEMLDRDPRLGRVQWLDIDRKEGAYAGQDLYLAPPDQSAKLAEMEARKDAAYYERNQVVAALAKCFPAGTARTAIEGWSEDWHGCVYIDLPTGQVSWHYHDTHAHLFAGLPAYPGKWDGHSTDAKYSRLSALVPQPDQSARIMELEGLLVEALNWYVDSDDELAGRIRAALGGEVSMDNEFDELHIVQDALDRVTARNELIATLTRERDEALAEVERLKLEVMAAELLLKMRQKPQADMVPAEEVERIKGELAAAREDAERLDWHEANPNKVAYATGYHGSKSNWTWSDAMSIFHDAPSLRAAIDAGRKGGGNGNG